MHLICSVNVSGIGPSISVYSCSRMCSLFPRVTKCQIHDSSLHNHWTVNAFKSPVRLSWASCTFFHFWRLASSSSNQMHWSGEWWKLIWIKHLQAKRFYDVTDRQRERLRGQKIKKKDLGWRRKSGWNMNHCLLFLWELIAVCGGAEVGE